MPLARTWAQHTYAANAALKVPKMSDVIVVFKVMPSGIEVDLTELEKEITKHVNPQRVEREPVAFGLVALNVTTLIPDAEGQLENIENKLREMKNVESVEVVEITRSI